MPGLSLARLCFGLMLSSLLAAVPSMNRPLGFSFSPASGLSNRLITPNGDGKNDIALFTFSNPRDSAVSGRIYDVRGAYVADMSAGPTPGVTLLWDGKAAGRAVVSGLYVYVLSAESAIFTGTVAVVR